VGRKDEKDNDKIVKTTESVEKDAVKTDVCLDEY